MGAGQQDIYFSREQRSQKRSEMADMYQTLTEFEERRTWNDSIHGAVTQETT